MNKPPHGDPCNGCGLCCQTELCPIGVATFKQRAGPCPAIEAGPVCGLAMHPQNYVPAKVLQYGNDAVREAAELLIAAGQGCDFYLPGEPTSREFYAKMHKRQRADPRYDHAKTIWFNFL